MRKQLNLIQLSRALVPLFVILFHANEMMDFYFDYNFLGISIGTKSGGVYYFFALSGFMMYYLYHKDFGNQGIMKRFLNSRFIKIYPVYWILTFCILPLYFIFPSFGDGSETEFLSIIASLLLLPQEHDPILGVAWSLVHTVFFYLMFTLVFLKNRMIATVILFVWASFSLIFSVNLLTSSSYLLNFIFNFNSLIFLAGIGCAFLVLKIQIHYYLSLLFIVIGLIGFPLSWFNDRFDLIDIGLLQTTTGSSILIILGLASIDLQQHIKIPILLKYLGDASFSIYLSHQLTLSLVSKVLSSVQFLSTQLSQTEIGRYALI